MNLFRSTTAIENRFNYRSPLKNNTLMMCVVAALAIFTSPVDAAKIVNQSIPITLSVPVACNVGEVVDLSGRLHTVITFTSNGRRVNAHVHVNAEIRGTGEITGRTFQANGEINISFHKSLLNGQGTRTFITSLEVTGQFVQINELGLEGLSGGVALRTQGSSGPGGSVIGFTLQETAHVTFNAKGAVTVNFDNFNAACM
jgi:hypothetical protein